MFVIRLLDGEEIHGTGDDRLVVNPDTGVLTVEHSERFGKVTTHYSPSAWHSVTHRVNSTAIGSSVPSGVEAVRGAGVPAGLDA